MDAAATSRKLPLAKPHVGVEKLQVLLVGAEGRRNAPPVDGCRENEISRAWSCSKTPGRHPTAKRCPWGLGEHGGSLMW